MLEIFLLWSLAGGVIGSLVESKGYKSFWFKVMTIGAWIVCEVIAYYFTGFYLLALAGGIIGALIAYLIAYKLPNRKPPETSSMSM